MAGILSIKRCCGVPLVTAALIIGFFSLCIEIPVLAYFIIFNPRAYKYISIAVTLFLIDISWVLGICRKWPMLMVMSLFLSIFIVLMTTFFVLFTTWAYIIIELGTIYYEHSLKYKITDIKNDIDEVIILILKKLFDNMNEVSLVNELNDHFETFRKKFQIIWIAVFVFTLIYWFIVAIKHSMFKAVRLEANTEKTKNLSHENSPSDNYILVDSIPETK